MPRGIVDVRLEGLREFDQNLDQLKRGMHISILRAGLRRAAIPMLQEMRNLAPKNSGALKKSIRISGKLSPRQKRLHREDFQRSRSSVELFIGAGPNVQAIVQEFGTIFHPAQPFARPAFNRQARPTLERLRGALGEALDAAAKRVARRVARRAAR